MNLPGYEALADVLTRAYDQAATGKGAERHARGEPFDEQVMQEGARRFGVGALLFQAFKKMEESQRLPHDAAVRELLGAINYTAGAVIAIEARLRQPAHPGEGATAAQEAKLDDDGWVAWDGSRPGPITPPVARYLFRRRDGVIGGSYPGAPGVYGRWRHGRVERIDDVVAYKLVDG